MIMTSVFEGGRIKEARWRRMTETARMRGLLAELGRLGAEEAEVPTRLEGIGSVGRDLWNRNFRMSPGYVADRCAEVLAVWDVLKLKTERNRHN